MYRKKDIDKIISNIDKIKNDAEITYQTKIEPTLYEQKEVYTNILNYIKKKKRIIYGGFSQNLLIEKKNSDKMFYNKFNGIYYNGACLADIEFYSYDPINDLINITEMLYNKKFKYIEGKEGIHKNTYKVYVNFINYCDISYIPKYIYDNLSYITINNIRCAHPYFMLIDTYRVLTDPLTSYWRLDKTLLRSQLISSYYPFYKKKDKLHNILNKDIMLDDINTLDVLQYIKKNIINKFKLIIIGYFAYNYYINKINSKYIIQNIPYYEMISLNLIDDAKQIYNILIKLYNNNITVEEYYPFFEYTDSKIKFYYKKKLIIILYGNNNKCIINKYLKKKNIYYGNVNLIILYLLITYYYNKINKINNYINIDNEKIDVNIILIIKLIYYRDKYLELHKLSIIDKSPFQEFIPDCLGNTIKPQRQSILNILKKKKFKYNPSGTINKIDYTYDNISGNKILNQKYLIFKNI